MYADDILLISPSVVYLEQLLHACERELKWLDMSINLSKSCCLRIGPRSNIICAAITSLTGHWPVSEIRYLGVYFVQSRSFKCSLDAATRGFYCAANSIFCKVGRIASEEVIIQLILSKCMPILTYGLEILSSIDFSGNCSILIT